MFFGYNYVCYIHCSLLPVLAQNPCFKTVTREAFPCQIGEDCQPNGVTTFDCCKTFSNYSFDPELPFQYKCRPGGHLGCILMLPFFRNVQTSVQN